MKLSWSRRGCDYAEVPLEVLFAGTRHRAFVIASTVGPLIEHMATQLQFVVCPVRNYPDSIR
jgi:hypothetical protein